MSPRSRRSVFLRAGAAGVLLTFLAGCTAEEDPAVHDARTRWARTALPSERAGTLDAFDSGPLTAENAFSGSLRFDSVPVGEFDVYLACRGGWQIKVDITGARSNALGSTTLLCDAATAVEVTTVSPGLTVTATAPGENTDWAVVVLPKSEGEVPDENALPEEAA